MLTLIWAKMEFMNEKREKFEILCRLLVEENAKYNLTRITEPEEVEVRHFQDSVIVVDILRDYERVLGKCGRLVDIGSGAGFPSLALAIVLDGWDFVSVESTGKKAKFQEKASERLGLENFQVINARAEELGHEARYREKFDAATARAVGHLGLIAELTAGFLKVGGISLAWKGPKVEDEFEAANEICGKTGMQISGDIRYSLGEGDFGLSDCRIIKMFKVNKTSVEYPRSFGVMKNGLKKGI